MIVNHHFSNMSNSGGLTILLVSHFENIFNMIYLKHLLNSVFGVSVNPNFIESSNLPTNNQVELMIRRIQGLNFECSRSVITDSIYFYHQARNSIHLSGDQIAHNPWIENISEIPSVYEMKTSIEDGRKIDRFGLSNVHFKNIQQTAKHLLNDGLLSSKSYIDEITSDFFQLSIEKFIIFKSEYRNFKEKMIKEGRMTFERLKLKFDHHCEILSRHPLYDEDIMKQSYDYRRRKGILDQLKDEIDNNEEVDNVLNAHLYYHIQLYNY